MCDFLVENTVFVLLGLIATHAPTMYKTKAIFSLKFVVYY